MVGILPRKPTKRKPRKGFLRSQKEWEETIARHIGKFIDNLKGEDLLNLIAGFTTAAAAFRAAKIIGADDLQALGASGSGIIAYQLAKSMNLVAGASGTAYLAGLGLINVWGPGIEAPVREIIESQHFWGGWLPIWCKPGSAYQKWLFPEETPE